MYLVRKLVILTQKKYPVVVFIQLHMAVGGYVDCIENLIERGNIFTMEQFGSSIGKFRAFREY